MNEDFLYYLWRHQKFNAVALKTVHGNSLEIIKTGFYNTNSGPDFSEGHIKLDNISWYGQIEMHIKTSDWEEHNHQYDPAYNNVVLHVVWEHDKEIVRQDGSKIPTLEVKKLVAPNILSRYRLLKEALDVIPCRNQVKDVEQIHLLSMVERCTSRRLQKKADKIQELLEQTNGDWEETTYQLIMKYLGFKVNALPMEQLSKMLPFKLLRKNAHQQKEVEALLFGQAGLLKEPKDDYSKDLRKRYDFNKTKYNLPEPLQPYLWKFMRMRPANFPTLRLAQFASITVKNPHLFDLFLNEEHVTVIKKRLQVPPGEYWRTHYHFSDTVEERNATMGVQAIYLLIINVIAPLRASYASFSDNYTHMESALRLLQQVPFEKNKIMKAYEGIDLPKESAFDSQGTITLFEDYCKDKKCLDCDIGVALLKK